MTKQLTKKDIVDSLKQVGFVTEKKVKKIVTEIVMDATEAILNGVQRMFDEQNKINDAKFATKEDLKKVENKVDWARDDIKGLQEELSNTPSCKEFGELKARVDSYHPVS